MQQGKSIWIGVLLSAGSHIAACVFFAFNGLTYIYPPPPEDTFVIDFTEEEEEVKPKQTFRGWQPTAPEVDRTKKIELIQKSESPYKATNKTNLTTATKQDDFGDVDTPEVKHEKEPELDPRASFPGMSKKDTSLTAPHSAMESSESFKEGQTLGNTASGRTEGAPNARVKGRMTVGNLPRPGYNVQESGTVVVAIVVDNYGKVTKAVPGAEGTTVTNKTLWNEARKAALGTHFNQDINAPALQEGTITYVFKLQ